MFGADSEEIALIHNTTEGMNLIAFSMDLKPGDEVILSDHEHTSAVIPWQYWQETKGIIAKTITLEQHGRSRFDCQEWFQRHILNLDMYTDPAVWEVSRL